MEVVGLKLSVDPNHVLIDKGIIGRLMYIAHTRQYLTYALSIVSEFMHKPGKQHMNSVIRILRYLKSTYGKGIFFTKNVDHRSVHAYNDNNWAKAIDDGRFTSGFTFVSGNLVTLRSKKKNVIARSIVEAEYRGITLRVCKYYG